MTHERGNIGNRRIVGMSERSCVGELACWRFVSNRSTGACYIHVALPQSRLWVKMGGKSPSRRHDCTWTHELTRTYIQLTHILVYNSFEIPGRPFIAHYNTIREKDVQPKAHSHQA